MCSRIKIRYDKIGQKVQTEISRVEGITFAQFCYCSPPSALSPSASVAARLAAAAPRPPPLPLSPLLLFLLLVRQQTQHVLLRHHAQRADRVLGVDGARAAGVVATGAAGQRFDHRRGAVLGLVAHLGTLTEEVGLIRFDGHTIGFGQGFGLGQDRGQNRETQVHFWWGMSTDH